ncbi:MAG TPA: CBS domain-containing protein [Blastocatellia bacterium]|nr:CBS domain-containing protein [Blastocatellia bacterium]
MNTLYSLVRGRSLYSIQQHWTVLEAARYMTEKRIGAAAVVDGERCVGVFSERDLMTRVIVEGRKADQTPVAEVMTREVVACRPEENCEDGLRQMQQANCRHLPIIVDDGRLVGFVSLRDLMQIELAEKDEELRHINAYVHSTGY